MWVYTTAEDLKYRERLWNWSPNPCPADSPSCRTVKELEKRELAGRAVTGIGLTLAVAAAVAVVALIILSVSAPLLIPLEASIALWCISSASLVLGVTLVGIGRILPDKKNASCECGKKPLTAARNDSDHLIANARKKSSATYEKIEALPNEARQEEIHRVEKGYRAALDSLKLERDGVLNRLRLVRS